MASYIAQSALASFILEIAQTHVHGITGLTLDFTDQTMLRTNWRVADLREGSADRVAALAAVALVARQNSGWVMVPDDSPLDGQVVSNTEQGA